MGAILFLAWMYKYGWPFCYFGIAAAAVYNGEAHFILRKITIINICSSKLNI